MYHSTRHTVPSFFPLCYYTTGAVIVIILLVSVLVMLTIDIVLLIVLINLIMLIVIMITTSAAFISKISTDQLATRECISFFSKRAVRVKGSSRNTLARAGQLTVTAATAAMCANAPACSHR